MDRTGRILQRSGQPQRAVAVMLQQMKRHALGCLGTYAWKRPERCDETFEARQRFLRRACRSFAIVHRQGRVKPA
jgi:hypothetical protein